MTVSVIKLSEGLTTKPGQGVEGIFQFSWDAATTTVATGDAIDLTDYFTKILAVETVGMTDIDMCGYTPRYFFDPTAALAADGLKVAMEMIPALDGDAASAQDLTPADGVDLTAVGSVTIKVTGVSK